MSDHAASTAAECPIPRSKELHRVASKMVKVILKDLALMPLEHDYVPRGFFNQKGFTFLPSAPNIFSASKNSRSFVVSTKASRIL